MAALTMILFSSTQSGLRPFLAWVFRVAVSAPLSTTYYSEIKEEDSFLFGFIQGNLHLLCMHVHCMHIRHQDKLSVTCGSNSSSTEQQPPGADELAPTRLASPVDGAHQGARCTVSMMTSPTRVPSPVWRKHETSPKVRRQPESPSGRAQASRTSVRDGGSKLSRHMHARDPYAHTLTHCPWPFRCHRVLLFSSEP